MVNYNRSAQTARRLIRKYGQKGKIRRAGVDTPAVIAVLDYKTKDIDGTRIKDGDRLIYVEAKSVQRGDVLVDKAGTPYTIIVVNTLAPAGTVVYHKTQCRGVR